MFKVLKYLKHELPTVCIIIVLLFVQAMCDLALPNYTSNIIDVGIQNGGIEYSTPEILRGSEYEKIAMFMTQDEKEKWESHYTKDGEYYRLKVADENEWLECDDTFRMAILMNSTMSKVEESKFREQIATQMGADASMLNQLSLEQISQMMSIDIPTTTVTEIDDTDSSEHKVTYVDMRPMLAAMLQSGNMSEEQMLAIRDSMQEGFETVGDSLIHSMAVSYVKEEYKQCNVDLDNIQTTYLWHAGLKMLAMAMLMGITAIAVGFFASRVGARIGMNLRSGIFKKVVGFSNTEMDQFSTASLITRSTNDIQQIQMVSTMFLRMLAYAPILALGGIICAVRTGAGMSWIIVVAVLTLLGFVSILMSVAMPKFKAMQRLVDKLNLVSREILTGISVIRAFGREKREEERFDEANKDLTKTMLFTNRVMTFMMPFMMMLMNAVSILIVWVASNKIDEGTIQVGAMTAFITYTMMIVMSFLMLTMMSIMLPRAAVAADRVDEVLNTSFSIVDKKETKQLENLQGEVAFNHVSFRYPQADENVLEDIDFIARPGQTTAIIGSTGAGKSTLIHLIPRFYDVQKGSITIDGIDIRDVAQETLRDQIGFVPQKGNLFSGTIATNLRFGCKDASDEEIAEAAKIAQATEFIEEKKERYDSGIAQGGSNVSGGQKQRLSIARAIAKNPKIYIFDDSFSALDFKTDVALRKALNEKVGNAVVIIVAQRISTILHADQILVLDEGKIVGKGTHEELLLNCDEYLQIAKSQLSEEEIANSVQGKEDACHE